VGAAQQGDEADEVLSRARLLHGVTAGTRPGAPEAPWPSQLIAGVGRTRKVVMRVRWAPGQGLDMAGARGELCAFHDLLLAVSQGQPPRARVPVLIDGDPAPYDLFLSALEVHLSNGPAVVRVVESNRVEVTGSSEALRGLASFFDFNEEASAGYHHHVEYYDGHPFISPTSEPLVVTVGRAADEA